MESDESTDLVDSEAVNAYESVVAKEERENPCKHFLAFINFFLIEVCHPC